MVVDPCFSSWADYLHSAWRADANGVRDVLDVCCGTGLLAAELLRLGYRVVGVDGSASMLARARDRLGNGIELHQAWLPDLATDAQFDAVVSSFDSLNYVPDAVFTASIEAVATRLRPGGWFVFDIHAEGLASFIASNPDLAGSEDGRSFTLHNELDANGNTCRTSVEVTLADGTRFREEHVQYLHPQSLVRSALAAGGFTSVAVVEEYSHLPVDDTTLRATWIARRASA